MSNKKEADPRSYIGLSHFDNPEFLRDNKNYVNTKLHIGAIIDLAFIENGKKLVTTGQDDTIRFWDISNGQLLHTLYCNVLNPPKINQDETLLATISQLLPLNGQISPTTLSLWDLQTGVLVDARAGGELLWKGSPYFNKDNSRIASFYVPNVYQLWSLERNNPTGSQLKFLEEIVLKPKLFQQDKLLDIFRYSENQTDAGGSGSHLLCFPSSGKILFVSNLRDGATIIDLDKIAQPYKWLRSLSEWFYHSTLAKPLNTPANKFPAEAVLATLSNTFAPFCFSPDYSYFAGFADDHTIKIWNWRDNSLYKVIKVDAQYYNEIVIDHANARIAVGSQHSLIAVWDIETGQKIMGIEGIIERVD